MRIPIILGITLLFLAISFRFPSPSMQDEIKKKQSQLQKLKKDIDDYEGKIKEKEKKEHSTLDLLDTYDRQAVLLRKLIARLHDQDLSLQLDITTTKRSIGELSGQIDLLRRHYAGYVTATYTRGKVYDLELLLSSGSLNQLLVRSEYLKRFSDQRRRELEKITNKREELQGQNTLLQDQLGEQRKLIDEKARESKKLERRMKKRKGLLTEIRRDKKNYQKEIARKTQAAKDVEQLIARLIEEDRVRREHEVKTSREKNLAEREPRTGAFEIRKGSLRWPVAQGKIVAHFGAQQHPVLHTVTQNTGIDISVPSGTTVLSVADGEVSTIWWLPSFGNLVIVNHQNGFRTVSAHLSEISVAEGQKVREGEELGRSGESLAGPMLHFEIWKDRDKQDPELWLRPQGLSQR